MLAKHKNKIDIDGYTTLLFSTLVMFATVGISYLFCIKKILRTAKNTRYQRSQDEMRESVMICVLGKKLINDKPDGEYFLRLQRAVHILSENKNSQVLLLGGKTGQAKISEAAAGRAFILKNNIAPERVYLEEKSCNTLENIINAIDLLNENNKKIILISNRYHLARAKQMAKGLGFEVDVCAAEEKLTINSLTAFKLLIEALHIHWYSVGRYYAHLTKNNRMIRRVG
jgi:vancomycin permeability regulator SanA